ncbi:unnamed protein product [Brachionus calyciflorus]|uniref:Uncharacterized protein n=1 Tax=Brachionus calyciflorus TaxID=104777 RepID=A0A814I642_9BILA|nr:unnamed protein product [Brachionus calyciflorus]
MNIEVIETTFGQVKIFKDKTEVVNPKKSKIDEKISEKSAQTNLSDSENFFGLEEDNFFEKKILEDYKINREISKPDKTTDEKLVVAPSEINKNDLNFIDEIYFANLPKYTGLEGIFAIDKPYGFAKGPGVHLSVSKLLPILEKMLKLNYRLLVCNRLDEYTTDVMLFANKIIFSM